MSGLCHLTWRKFGILFLQRIGTWVTANPLLPTISHCFTIVLSFDTTHSFPSRNSRDGAAVFTGGTRPQRWGMEATANDETAHMKSPP